MLVFVAVDNKSWNNTVLQMIQSWRSQVLSWCCGVKAHPILFVHYEDMKADRIREVKRMLTFLGVPYEEGELRRSLVEDFSQFQRSKHVDFDPYTPEQRAYARKVIEGMIKEVRKSIGDSLGLEMYLH